MENECDISFIIVTYNCEYEKLFGTIFSILKQKNIKFEIIIADDGSTNFDMKRIDTFFKSQQFSDYKIVANKINQGTVKNVLSGLACASGKFVKTISPGDFLYSSSVSYRALMQMYSDGSDIIFGRAAHYSNEGQISIHDVKYPHVLWPYLKDSRTAKGFNYIFHKDYILGASFIIKTDLMMKYIEFIMDRIKYTEDSCVILMTADGVNVDFFNEFFVWYEQGTGISTSGDDKWGKILKAENIECYKILKDRQPKYACICDWHCGNKNFLTFLFRCYNKIYWIIVDILEKLFYHPDKKVDVNELKTILEFSSKQ